VNLLQGLSWTGRAQGLEVLIDIFSTAEVDFISAACGVALVQALKLIPGRIWKGQEIIFELFVIIFKRFKHTISADIDFSDDDRALIHCYGARVDGKKCCISLNNVFSKKLTSTENVKVDEYDLDMEVDVLEGRKTSEQVLVIPQDDSSPCELKNSVGTMVHKFVESIIDDSDSGSSVVISYGKSWKIIVSGCLQFLLHEASRGDKQYRLSAARAIAVFPMELSCGGGSLQAKSLVNYTSPFCKCFSWLLRLIGFEFSVYKAPKTTIETSRVNDSLPLKTKSIVTVSASKAPISRNNAALFGSRYGGGGVTTTSNSRKRVLVQDPKAASNPSCGGSSDSTIEEKILELPIYLRPPDDGDLCILSIASSSPSSVDPAFKAKLMDAIAMGIEYGIVAGDYLDLTHVIGLRQDLAHFRLCYIRWARDMFLSTEFWSIRKSCIILSSGALISCAKRSEDVVDTLGVLLDIVLHMLSIGSSDIRSSQLRVASLVNLSRLMQCSFLNDLLIAKKDIIENIFAIVAQEKKADVIEQGSKTLKNWKLLKLGTEEHRASII